MSEAAQSLYGKRILITGGASRIGRGLALAFASHGARVAITYRNSDADAEAVLLSIVQDAPVLPSGEDAPTSMALRMNVRDQRSVQEAVDAVVEEFGGIDLLVNNAGHFETAALESVTIAQWDAMLETNTRGPLLVAQAAHPFLKQAHGRILNIGSLGGMHPWPTHGHYCASKAALHMLSQTMAKAWAPEISVNAIAPGMVVSGEVDAGYEQFAEKTPMKRNGTVADVAAAALFFATAPHFITGQILAVDGGLGL
jgi:3-oxoacyl-[acyl-carrier protein] reductase/pteridine reductase